MMDTHEQPSEIDCQLRDFFEELDAKVDSATKTYQAELTGFFAGLGTAVDIAKRAQAELDRIAATRFSVFRYFNTRELDLSRIFADLLDPSGRHGQGDCFLRFFLDGLKKTDGFSSRMISSLPSQNLYECKVHLEFSTATGRRIDIVLEMPDGLWIGIENKPWAEDQDRQIEDYLKDLMSREMSRETACVLYFSGDGKKPTKPTPEEQDRCLTVSYRRGNDGSPSLEHWIEQCREKCEAEVVRWFLKDLLKYIRREFKIPGTRCVQRRGEWVMTQDDNVNTTKKFILGNSRYLKLAFNVEKAASRIRGEAVMTQDLVVDATVQFIRENKRCLELAVNVGKAASRIREEAVEKVLKRVVECLEEKFDRNDWVVKLVRTTRSKQPWAVQIKKKSWPVMDLMDFNEKNWEGVRVDRKWDYPLISVSPFEGIEAIEIQKLFRTHKLGEPRVRGRDVRYVTYGLEGALRDWEGAEFVSEALNNAADMAAKMANKMAILAQEIDELLA